MGQQGFFVEAEKLVGDVDECCEVDLPVQGGKDLQFFLLPQHLRIMGSISTEASVGWEQARHL